MFWTGPRVKKDPLGSSLWEGAEDLAVAWGSSALHLYLQMQPAISDCKMGHPLHEICHWYCFIHSWRVTAFYISTALWEGLCHWKAWLSSLLCQQNTGWAFWVSNGERSNCLQTHTAYDGLPSFCSLFLAHKPLPRIPLILLKSLVAESFSLTPTPWPAIIAAVAGEICPICVA